MYIFGALMQVTQLLSFHVQLQDFVHITHLL
jgi:hypothetical protein